MPFWVFDVRLRNRALLSNNLKIIFEVRQKLGNVTKKWNYLLRNICWEKKGRRLPNSPKWRPKRPITLRCEKMPKKARGEVLSLIILILPRTFWSSCRFAISKLPIFAQIWYCSFTKTIPTCPYENWKKWVVRSSYGSSPCLTSTAYVRFFHLSTIINLVFNQRFRVMVRKKKEY